MAKGKAKQRAGQGRAGQGKARQGKARPVSANYIELYCFVNFAVFFHVTVKYKTLSGYHCVLMHQHGRTKPLLVCVHISQNSDKEDSTMARLACPRSGLACTSTVPDRHSAKDTPVGCQLATMALKIKTVTIPKMVDCTAEVVTHSGTSVYLNFAVDWAQKPNYLSISASRLSCTRLADFLPPWQ